ncbi:shikimate dehydrogenase [uncultured Acetatifactor sp.]|uniref:shikimate dehydrogenase n=1 Tax=uncultured Acetatifactor sp. TaxID=1671927 RepID=UPI002638C24B|nr:shikimate dehydrogenase [uncultured Acetatifactor sp.]
MEINGYTRTCGVIGHPVEHTMSPAIHNTLARELGENLVYVPFHVPVGHVGQAVEGAYALNLLGMNVTVPYKSEVLPYLKETDPLAETIGAVNTLVRTEGGFKGYNTDMPGLYRAMCEDGVEIAGERVLILGAGGVARAVAILAAEKKAAEIIILNRTREKAARIAEEVNGLGGRQLAGALALEEYASLPEGNYLAIQATNVGMFPKTGEAVIEDAAFYRKIHTGYDLVFNPARTRFMSLVQQSGGRAFGGLKMLLYQGIIAYELWTGAQVDWALAEKAYEQMRKAMDIAESR